MKKNSLLVLLLLVISSTFAQKVIDSPQYGISTFPGEIRRIELTKSATILHFHLHSKPNGAIYIPKGSCIKVAGTDEKLFVTKTEGIPLNKKYKLNDSGIANYKLHFPPLKEDIGKIDFSESNKGGSWHVYDIVIDEAKFGSLLPKGLKGNWLKTDGSNTWKYGLYNDRAVIDKIIWTYKSVKQKRKSFELVLENDGKIKTVFAKLNKDKTFSFGSDKKHLVACSLKPTNNKNYKLKNDLIFAETNLFQLDSTVYSGIIRSVHKGSEVKTGMVYVRNIFTGNQESYLVKINNDGSFHVKFPLYHPQQVYVRLPGYRGNVFFEPGKETWQLINSSKRNDVYFSGDCAQVNSDLVMLNTFSFDRAYSSLRRIIKKTSLDEYAVKCKEIYEKQKNRFAKIRENKFLSKKTIQVMEHKLEYGYYENVLSYDMYRGRGQEPKIDKAFMRFLASDVYRNKMGVISGNYSSFINRLRFCEPMSANSKVSVTHPSGVELAKLLKEKGVEITADEQKLMDEFSAYNTENAAAIKKMKDFNSENMKTNQGFYTKYGKIHQKLSEEDRKKTYNSEGLNIDSLIIFAKTFEVNFTKDEIAVQRASKKVLTKEEKAKNKSFYSKKRVEALQSFQKKYKSHINDFVQEEFRNQKLANTTTLFAEDESWMSDLFIMQEIARPIVEQLSPLEKEDLQIFFKKIKTPFVKDYLVYENKRAYRKIEQNKNNDGFVLNETPNTEADKLFDKIIAKYKGKVVFVDFWATWCAPCRSGIKKMIPLKEELKNEDVVFLYITDQSSPEKTYNNMIPEIKGEHFRISSDEWNYMKAKFKISGIPHYSLIDKNGNLVENKIRLQTNEGYKKLIKDHL